MEVLTILVPLELRIRRLIRSALIQRFADAKATAGGMPLAFFLGQPADPTLSWIVISMATQDVMHLVDEFPCELQITVLAGLPREAEEVTDRERIGPEIAARLRLSGDTGGVREFLHQGLSEISSHAASGYQPLTARKCERMLSSWLDRGGSQRRPRPQHSHSSIMANGCGGSCSADC